MHGQRRFLEQSLGEEQSLGLQDFDRSESEGPLQQASHLPAAEARQRSQFLDGFAVRRPALQLEENSLFQRRSASFSGSDLGAAAQAGSKPRLLRGSRTFKETARRGPRFSRRANRPAINARRLDADKEKSVETGISGRQRSVAHIEVRNHTASLVQNRRTARRFRTEIFVGRRQKPHRLFRSRTKEDGL